MVLEIWKVRHEAGDNPPWYSFSIRQGFENPVILYYDEFIKLFPDIDTKEVPTAPETGLIEVNAVLLKGVGE